ncbi:hypothetical protein [Kitasatospora sp. NPDC088134]|uniref:hypothetical protein n=1 Tax=Kitasatospora sp. NPDC088134 TaxID=3364071 RepID=UPI00381652EE
MTTGTMRLEITVDRYMAARLARFAGSRRLSVPRVMEMLLELSEMRAEDGTLRLGPFTVGTDNGPGPDWATALLAGPPQIEHRGLGGHGRDVAARVAPGPAGRDRYGTYGLRDRTTETPRQQQQYDLADPDELEPQTVHSHATGLTPPGPECTCGRAPCGGLAPLRHDCPEHGPLDVHLFWHAARFCLAAELF